MERRESSPTQHVLQGGAFLLLLVRPRHSWNSLESKLSGFWLHSGYTGSKIPELNVDVQMVYYHKAAAAPGKPVNLGSEFASILNERDHIAERGYCTS